MYIFPNSVDVKVQADIVEGNFQKKKGPNVIFIAFSGTAVTELLKLYPAAKKRRHLVSDVKVIFELKYSYFYRQHDILDRISKKVIAKIMPQSDQEFTDAHSFAKPYQLSDRYSKSAKLDYFQLTALESAMKCAPKAPFLIVGSFGTGKTRLIARAAMEILQENRQAHVLVCAHHQSSVDSFVVNYFSEVRVNMVRLMPPRYTPPQGYEKWYKTAKMMKSNEACKVQLMVTTLAISLHLKHLVKPGHFTHILMDEGAQAREPEAIAPLTFADENTKIIIAGDHKQVILCL